MKIEGSKIDVRLLLLLLEWNKQIEKAFELCNLCNWGIYIGMSVRAKIYHINWKLMWENGISRGKKE